MTGYSILNNVFNTLLSGGLVDKIYHDVVILEETGKPGNRYPAFPHGDEWIYVGVDDTKRMNCYFRQTGEARNIKTTPFAGCEQSYLVKVPYRMVVFNDFEKRNFDNLNAAFINIFFQQHIDFSALIIDKKKILTDESLPKNFTFGASTYYIAIDFFLLLQVNKNNCDEVIGCDKLPNPVCTINTSSLTNVLTVKYGYSETPFGDGTGGTVDKTSFDYQFTGSFLQGQGIITQFAGMPNNVYISVEYPASEPDKITWSNAGYNYGQIPDYVMNPIEVEGDKKYITSRYAITLDNLFTTIFS